MKTKFNLLKDSIPSLFLKYLLPSVSATLVTSIYILADTIMIGKFIGNDAVAALNIVLPLFSLFYAFGLLFGIGGAVLMSVSLGEKKEKQASAYFSTSLFLTAITSVICLLLVILFFKPLFQLLGTTKDTASYVYDYGKYFAFGIPFFIFSTYLETFLQNDKAAKHSMVAVIIGGVLNIILDYIFLAKYGFGMKGAAFATSISALLMDLILCLHFFKAKNTLHFRFQDISFSKIKPIITNGLSTFFIEVSSGIVIFTFNLRLLTYAGTMGIAVYSSISNIAAVVGSLNNGIARSAQPILSINYGAKSHTRVNETTKIGLLTSLTVGFLLALWGICFPEWTVRLFLNPTDEILALARMAIPIYFLSFFAMAGNIFLNTYFQSTLKPQVALVLSVLRGFVFCLVLLYVLPLFFGILGIWLVMPLTECTVFILALLSKKRFQTKLETAYENSYLNVLQNQE